MAGFRFCWQLHAIGPPPLTRVVIWPLYNVMRKRRVIIFSLVALIAIASVGFVAAARAKTRAQSAACAGMLFPLTFVAMEWATEHGDRYPTNLLYLSNQVATRWLICPSDSSRHAVHARPQQLRVGLARHCTGRHQFSIPALSSPRSHELH